MKYEVIRHSIRREISFTVEGATPVQLMYGKVMFLPDSAIVTTVGGAFRSVEVAGNRVLSNGKLGESRHSNRYWHRADIPEDLAWAPEIIAEAEKVR